ncbi:hypothetical protein [Zooshikella sp. RANM57]|uniref:hypothetical protein n=1 Tax=Zooshikella sp. RANM57 TaxID=3425863 RepID=UPI003D6E2FB1
MKTYSIFSLISISFCFSQHGVSDEPSHTITDPYLKSLVNITPEKKPFPPDPTRYGMNLKTGKFKHPDLTPEQTQPQPFPGQLNYWDTHSYIHNMTVEAYYPITVEPFHTWQNIVDFDGRRYLYQYVRRDLKIFDITYPKQAKLLFTKGSTWGKEGPSPEVNPFPPGEMMGASTIQWDSKRQHYIMVQAYEVQRFGLLHDKYQEPEKVKAIRAAPHLKGFKVYAMQGPLPDQWKLLATRTTDITHPDAPIGQQQGSGVRDIPTFSGKQLMFVAAAPSADYALTEYPNDLYNAGYQSWDMSDPENPLFLNQLTVPGQRVNNRWHALVYQQNPRAGNRTSWMGARMSLFIPPAATSQPPQYGYAAMGGLGFYSVDISNPRRMKTIAHLNFPPSVAGTEGDFIDISQINHTGHVYYSGYPLNEDCWEPYKHIYQIDVSNPLQPTITNVLPRPRPPKQAMFTDFCQRKGSFGPKRTGAYTQPGRARKGIIPYNFYNAGLQVFDVSNPHKPFISAYFVPPYAPDRVHPSAMGNLSHSVYVEYDRNLFWLFTNHGFYLLSSPVLGKPQFNAPTSPWPPHE